MKIKEGLNKIRDIIGQMEGSERQVLEEVVEEAEGWKMRLRELEQDDDDNA